MDERLTRVPSASGVAPAGERDATFPSWASRPASRQFISRGIFTKLDFG